jgi:hypothetical protein
MITTEKYIVLRIWTAIAPHSMGFSSESFMAAAAAGAIVGDLPENHKLFAMPPDAAVALLTDMSINELIRLRDSLPENIA